MGQIITSTMTNIIFWPILEFCVFFSLRFLARFYDRGCSCKNESTKKRSISDYIDLYAGPMYFIHYKYSYILNVVFITFMFGAGIPILFFQALAALIVLYICERLTLAYSCIPPPMFDQTLNRLAIKILMFAPLLYFSVGFWMFDSI